MKAREFLAQTGKPVELRNLVKEKLSLAEVKALAKRLGDARELVAPKRRAEAEGLDGEALLAWLAEDGARLRRPIVDVGGKALVLGFDAGARGRLGDRLR